MTNHSFPKFMYRLVALLLALNARPGFAEDEARLIRAARVFDGYALHDHAAVLIRDGKIEKIGPSVSFADIDAEILDLGDATLLPGFIDLHGHLSYQHVPAETVLRHGVTTLRDVGGPLHQPRGGGGDLRLMTSGPIITAPGGYPIPSLGEADIALPVADEAQARETVRQLIADGAVVVKVALEPGGEAGAPWSGGHAHSHAHDHARPAATHEQAAAGWPLLPVGVVKAIVDEAHLHGRKVSAHLAEERGAQIALDAGVDEWAHTPCESLPDELLRQVAARQVKIVSTMDTLSKCSGLTSNVRRMAALGVEFLYGAEIAHPDIPWGIDAQELLLLQHLAGMEPLRILNTATAKAGQYLGMPLLGTLLPGAPADVIAVPGDATQKLKLLEYPWLVISGGEVVVDLFAANRNR